MSTDLKEPPEQTAAALVSGIVDDLQHLVEQQIQLIRQEAGIELRRHAIPGLIICLGAGIALAGGVTVCLALSHLLYSMMGPASADPDQFPLWACYATVAALFLVTGSVAARIGFARFRSFEGRDANATTIPEEHKEWKSRPQ